MAVCSCGCGASVSDGRRFVSGHNLRDLRRTEAHRRNIGEAQRRAWDTKRRRLPLGQRRLDSDGYVLVKVVAGKGHWRGEHLLAMENLLGRKLSRSEIVHHVNALKGDNDPENLYLCRDRSQHNQVHASYEALLAGLLADGIVRFNREAGRYERTDQAILRGSD